jgi:hypothetical protein
LYHDREGLPIDAVSICADRFLIVTIVNKLPICDRLSKFTIADLK